MHNLLLYQTAALVLYSFFLYSYFDEFVLLVRHCKMLCFVDRASLYSLVNKANLVHNLNCSQSWLYLHDCFAVFTGKEVGCKIVLQCLPGRRWGVR